MSRNLTEKELAAYSENRRHADFTKYFLKKCKDFARLVGFEEDNKKEPTPMITGILEISNAKVHYAKVVQQHNPLNPIEFNVGDTIAYIGADENRKGWTGTVGRKGTRVLPINPKAKIKLCVPMVDVRWKNLPQHLNCMMPCHHFKKIASGVVVPRTETTNCSAFTSHGKSTINDLI